MSNMTDGRRLPRKRISAGALFRNEASEILLVKPHIKTYWDLPGGVIEQDESPIAGLVREIREELGFSFKAGRLLCLDYISEQPDAAEGLTFIFDGGVLHEEDINRIVLEARELADFSFFRLGRAGSAVNIRMSTRIRFCLAALLDNRTYYLENQKPVIGPGTHDKSRVDKS